MAGVEVWGGRGVGGVQKTQAHPCHGRPGGWSRCRGGSVPDQQGKDVGRWRQGGRVAGSGLASVARLGRDQWLTNDVYAVVLVDICWQNRSPVRHLEWN